jgi:hypothetical protein
MLSQTAKCIDCLIERHCLDLESTKGIEAQLNRNGTAMEHICGAEPDSQKSHRSIRYQ